MTYICLGRKVSKVEKFRFLQTCHSYNESAIVVSFQFLVLVVSRTLVVLVYYYTVSIKTFEPPNDKTNTMACASSEDSDQPGDPPSLIRVFAVRMKKAWVISYPLSAQRRL